MRYPILVMKLGQEFDQRRNHSAGLPPRRLNHGKGLHQMGPLMDLWDCSTPLLLSPGGPGNDRSKELGNFGSRNNRGRSY